MKRRPLMNIEEIRQECHLFVENFPDKIAISLFGSKVHKDKLDLELDEVFGSDIDLLFEIDPELFLEYSHTCHREGVDFSNGNPIDPMDCFWTVFTKLPRIIRISKQMTRLLIMHVCNW